MFVYFIKTVLRGNLCSKTNKYHVLLCFHDSHSLLSDFLSENVHKKIIERIFVWYQEKARRKNPFHKCCFNVTSLSCFPSSIQSKMVHKVDRPWKSYQFVKISRQGIIVKSRIKKSWILLSFWKLYENGIKKSFVKIV